MANKWLTHVKKTMKQMKSKGSYKKGDGLKKVILEAKKTYKRSGSTITLLPSNPTMEPMVFSAAYVVVFGKIVTVMRKL
jgi:hypothetical protein